MNSSSGNNCRYEIHTYVSPAKSIGRVFLSRMKLSIKRSNIRKWRSEPTRLYTRKKKDQGCSVKTLIEREICQTEERLVSNHNGMWTMFNDHMALCNITKCLTFGRLQISLPITLSISWSQISEISYYNFLLKKRLFPFHVL